MKIKDLKINSTILLLMVLFFIYKYLYFRSFSGFFGESDTDNYLSRYGDVSWVAELRPDYFYYLFSYLCSLFFSFEFFLAVVGVLFFYSIASFLRKSIGMSYWIPFFLVGCFFYPSYISASELVVRQGVGFAVLFFSSFYLGSTSLRRKIACILLASLFHSGFLFYLLIVWLNKKLINVLKPAISLWVLVTALYALNIPAYLVDLLPSLEYFGRSLDGYIEAEYVVGFKLNFALLSAIPAVLLIYPGFSRYVRRNAEREHIYVFYLLSNSCGMLFSGFGYYDRVMLFSWVLVPLIFCNFIYWIFSTRRRIVIN